MREYISFRVFHLRFLKDNFSLRPNLLHFKTCFSFLSFLFFFFSPPQPYMVKLPVVKWACDKMHRFNAIIYKNYSTPFSQLLWSKNFGIIFYFSLYFPLSSGLLPNPMDSISTYIKNSTTSHHPHFDHSVRFSHLLICTLPIGLFLPLSPFSVYTQHSNESDLAKPKSYFFTTLLKDFQELPISFNGKNQTPYYDQNICTLHYLSLYFPSFTFLKLQWPYLEFFKHIRHSHFGVSLFTTPFGWNALPPNIHMASSLISFSSSPKLPFQWSFLYLPYLKFPITLSPTNTSLICFFSLALCNIYFTYLYDLSF